MKNFRHFFTPFRELTEQEAVEKVEESLFADTVVTCYEIGKDTEVTIDGSPLGLGNSCTEEK